MNWTDYISDAIYVLSIMSDEAEAALERRKEMKR